MRNLCNFLKSIVNIVLDIIAGYLISTNLYELYHNNPDGFQFLLIIITTGLGVIVTDVTVHMILNRKYMEEDSADKLRKMWEEVREDKE
jgi:hypothetical protein